MAELSARRGTRACPCSDVEIDTLERSLGAKLPRAYRSLLACDGRGGHRILEGTDWTYPSIVEIQRWARALAERDGLALPARTLIVAMHQGYQFFFVDLDDGEDPRVWHYLERRGRAVEFAPTLTAAVEELVESELGNSDDLFGR
ncbi:SMI1/KNR4 family protein [Sandaracinus amylolyticus]|uniref:SMI1/KNR4 family protein n=1 Tax=Sandaracinus amylolyticus TaxID=927083 RepID=UPI001F1E4D02|nr:SMI1/KNR4 family protein [Sandaracinus amylolyticus]